MAEVTNRPAKKNAKPRTPASIVQLSTVMRALPACEAALPHPFKTKCEGVAILRLVLLA
jgi:hypothetical protein